MWNTNIGREVIGKLGEPEWSEAEREARENNGFMESVDRKNALLIAATLENLASKDIKSAILERLCDSILTYSESVPEI